MNNQDIGHLKQWCKQCGHNYKGKCRWDGKVRKRRDHIPDMCIKIFHKNECTLKGKL